MLAPDATLIAQKVDTGGRHVARSNCACSTAASSLSASALAVLKPQIGGVNSAAVLPSGLLLSSKLIQAADECIELCRLRDFRGLRVGLRVTVRLSHLYSFHFQREVSRGVNQTDYIDDL